MRARRSLDLRRRHQPEVAALEGRKRLGSSGRQPSTGTPHCAPRSAAAAIAPSCMAVQRLSSTARMTAVGLEGAESPQISRADRERDAAARPRARTAGVSVALRQMPGGGPGGPCRPGRRNSPSRPRARRKIAAPPAPRSQQGADGLLRREDRDRDCRTRRAQHLAVKQRIDIVRPAFEGGRAAARGAAGRAAGAQTTVVLPPPERGAATSSLGAGALMACPPRRPRAERWDSAPSSCGTARPRASG
jgi:hypothetical protein